MFLNKNGHTLLELLAAVAIISVLIYGGYAIYSRSQENALMKETVSLISKTHEVLVQEMSAKGFALFRQLFDEKGWNCDEENPVLRSGELRSYAECFPCAGGDCLRVKVGGLDEDARERALEELQNSGINADCRDDGEKIVCDFQG